MGRAQQQLIALGALILVMVAVYAKAFHRRAPQPHAGPVGVVEKPAAATAVAQEAPAISPPLEQRETQRQRAALLAWGRDPFTLGATKGERGALQLSGILWDANAPIAVINGQMVRPGEEVAGYRVVHISQDDVSLTNGANTIHLQINGDSR